jgi:hypothetical protein
MLLLELLKNIYTIKKKDMIMKKNKKGYKNYFIVMLIFFCFYSIGFTEIYNYYIGTYTPKGTAIYFPDLSGYPELNQQWKDFYASYVQENYGWCGACVLQAASKYYNCHSYAWNISEGGAIGWMNTYDRPNELNKYWDDSSYIQEEIEARADKISYPGNDHSAIATTVQDVFISKWDERPVVKHPRGCNPYSGTGPGAPTPTVNYYSRYNREISSNTTYPSGTDRKFASHSTFTTGNNVVVANGAKIIYVSHGAMNIQSGFTVQYGAQFTATTW